MSTSKHQKIVDEIVGLFDHSTLAMRKLKAIEVAEDVIAELESRMETLQQEIDNGDPG